MLVEGAAPAPRPIAIIPIGAAAETVALGLAQDLRRAGFAVDLGFSGNLSRRMKRANRLHAVAAVIVGDDEMAKGIATLRDMATGDQQAVPLGEIAAGLAHYR
jgi:histidyl-tRNA synthetase